MSLSRGSLSREVSVWGSLSRESLSGGLCPGEGISVQGVYAEGRGSWSMGSLSGGFCPGGSLSGCPCPQGLHLGGFCAGGLCLGVTDQGVSVWGLCPGEGSLSRGSMPRGGSHYPWGVCLVVSVQEGLYQGVPVQGVSI